MSTLRRRDTRLSISISISIYSLSMYMLCTLLSSMTVFMHHTPLQCNSIYMYICTLILSIWVVPCCRP
jgi:hypothetical protein